MFAGGTGVEGVLSEFWRRQGRVTALPFDRVSLVQEPDAGLFDHLVVVVMAATIVDA